MNFDFNKMPGISLHASYCTDPIIPKISIITPFYNAGEYFENTFNCVMNQTFPWFEWIIVDDGSTNQADIDLLLDFVHRDSRIKYIRKENGGIASARNLAIERSSSEYIVPLDADDLISPVYLEINYWALHFNPNAAWSYTDSIGFGTQCYLWKKHFSSKMMCINNILTCTAMIRKSALMQVGCYSQLGKNFNEDWHTWLKLMSIGRFPLHLAGYHFWYRRKDNGVLGHIRSNPKEKRLSEKFIKEIAKKVPSSITAVEYPVASKINVYIPPQVSDWTYKRSPVTRPSLLLILPWMEMGGADSFNLAFIKSAQKKFHIGIITTNYCQNSWKQKFDEVCDDIFSLPEFLEVHNYAEFISYYIKTRDTKMVLVSNSYYGYYLLPWLRIQFPRLLFTDYVHMEELYWRNGGYARTSSVFDKLISHTFVCNSSTKDVMIRHFNKNPEHISTFHIGVDTSYYYPQCVPYGQVRDKFGLGKRKIVLFPCRIDMQKRPYLMLEIAALLAVDIPDIVFLVVGDGTELSALSEEIRRKGLDKNVILAGPQDDMRYFYTDSDLTLICSLKEGLALTAYESLAMGKPVISADVGGQKDLIDDSVGALVPTPQSESDLDIYSYSSFEAQEYVQKIKLLLNDNVLYDRLCINCVEKIRNNFIQQELLEKLTNKLLTLLKQDEAFRNIQETGFQLYSQQTMVADYLTVYTEIENYVNSYNYGLDKYEKKELMRIVNSKWGQRLIKLALKLHINRLFN